MGCFFISVFIFLNDTNKKKIKNRDQLVSSSSDWQRKIMCFCKNWTFNLKRMRIEKNFTWNKVFNHKFRSSLSVLLVLKPEQECIVHMLWLMVMAVMVIMMIMMMTMFHFCFGFLLYPAASLLFSVCAVLYFFFFFFVNKDDRPWRLTVCVFDAVCICFLKAGQKQKHKNNIHKYLATNFLSFPAFFSAHYAV